MNGNGLPSTSGEVILKETNEEKSLHVETKSGDILVSYRTAPQSLMLIANN